MKPSSSRHELFLQVPEHQVFKLNKTNEQYHKIRSFVHRGRRITKAQEYALENYWPEYGIAYQPIQLDLVHVFKRQAPVVIDIGVGTGDSTLALAMSNPENNYLAIEIHRPGIGRLLNSMAINRISNIRIINHDVIDVLQNQIAPCSISQILLFFPDPWPKKRHHKRRLVNTKLLQVIKRVLALHGRLHIATDWQDYANHIQELFNEQQDFINLAGHNNFAPRPAWRISTRYENRGLEKGYKIRDFCYGLNLNPKE